MKRAKIRNHNKRLVKNAGARVLLAKMLSCKNTGNIVRTIMFAEEREIWRGAVATPPGSFLEVVVAEFMRYTPVSAEIPFMTVISLVAQFLCEKGAALVMDDGQKIVPDLYTVLLAESGNMKSFSVKKILDSLALGGWKPNSIRDPGSTAGLVEEMSDNQGKAAFWWLEEFGQFWMQTKTEVHLGTPRVLLMAYDHAPITKRLKNSIVEVQSPCLSILGTTVIEKIHEKLTSDDWVSGLCQRFTFVFCPSDPNRDCKLRKYAMLNGMDLEKIATSFQSYADTPVHSDYRFSDTALDAIGDAWVLMGKQGITTDFVRRLQFRIFKYSIIYHWLLRKSSNEIDGEDVNWSLRLAMLHLSDLRKIMDTVEYVELHDLLRRVESLRVKHGANLGPRHLLMYMHRQLKSMPAAEALFSLLVDKENSAKASETAIKNLTNGS